MAVQKKAQEHALKKMTRDLKAGEIPGVIVLCGKEQYLVDFGLEAIVNRYVNPAAKMIDFVRFTEENASFEAVREACETLSMFSDRHIVAVAGFSPLESGKWKGFTETDEAALTAYAEDIPEGTILILTCGVPDKRKKLYQKIASVGSVYEFDTLSAPDLRSFIIRQMKAAGKYCTESVLSEMIADSGYYHKETDYTLYNLVNDLKKIIAYAEGEEITSGDVLAVISGSLETYIFALIDSITNGRRGEAFHLFYNILGSGESASRILSAIVSQYEFILDVKELRDQGLSKDAIAGELKVHEFRVKKALGLSERYTAERLRRVLCLAYDVDRNIKSGQVTQELAMELLLASV